MAITQNIASTWSAPVTLAQDEIWQARGGRICLTTTPNPTVDDGLALSDNQAVRFSAGTQVSYRKESPNTVNIIREAV